MSPEERRIKYAIGLHPSYLSRYQALCLALPLPWAPYCGGRSFIEQEALWHQGRTFGGPIVTNAMPGESGHNYFCASDWAYFAAGKNPWNDAPWNEYGTAVRALGLIWAGDWIGKIKEQPHNELKLKCSWTKVLAVFKAQGQESAACFISTMATQ